jgi:hypothetical protein
MAATQNLGPDSGTLSSHDYFSPVETSSASPARVAGWCQVRRVHATRGAPPGYRQGGPWGSKT